MIQKEFMELYLGHRKWLEDGSGKRMIIKHEDLRMLDIGSLDLSKAEFAFCPFDQATMSGASVACASFRRCDFYGVEACDLDARQATFSECTFSEADFSRSDFALARFDACFSRTSFFDAASMEGANLDWTIFKNDSFVGGSLLDASTDYARFVDCNLAATKGTRGIAFDKTVIVPREGAFIGYKPIVYMGGIAIAKLQITEGADRCNDAFRRCRASSATTLSITDEYGKNLEKIEHSRFGQVFEVGKTTAAARYNPDRFAEHGYGISFYLTEAEARNAGWEGGRAGTSR